MTGYRRFRVAAGGLALPGHHFRGRTFLMSDSVITTAGRMTLSSPDAFLASIPHMIGFPPGVRVWLATGHCDMRKGFPGLALLVQEKLKADPHCGHLFVFRGRRGGLVKVIWHDGQGACLFSKRLERGRFIWPMPSEGAVTISPAQLGYLLEGIDWRAPQQTWRPEVAG